MTIEFREVSTNKYIGSIDSEIAPMPGDTIILDNRDNETYMVNPGRHFLLQKQRVELDRVAFLIVFVFKI